MRDHRLQYKVIHNFYNILFYNMRSLPPLRQSIMRLKPYISALFIRKNNNLILDPLLVY